MSLFPDSSTVAASPRAEKKSNIFKRGWRILKSFFCLIGMACFAFFSFLLIFAVTGSSQPEIKPGTILRLNLDDGLYEDRASDFISSLTFGNTPTVLDIITGIRRASEDPNITHLVAYMTNPDLELTHVQEIRNAVKAFRQSGKKTVFYTPSFGELGGGMKLYYLAAAFEEIRMQPNGEVGLSGVAVETPYLKKALEKIGIKPSFEARYEYKSGADFLNADKMSEQERKNLTQILESFLDTIAADISSDRKIPLNKMKELLKNGPYFAEQALEMKLIDKTEYADVLEDELKKEEKDDKPAFMDVADYTAATEPEITEKTPVIAYIPATGIIQTGDSFFGGDAYSSILGSSSFSSILREAAENKSVKAIVIRLDSPGGGYMPSDEIRHELEYIKSKSKKPVVCSMGSTAASGGYFISLGCDTVIADPSTITGSIGVFGGKLVFKDLLNKLDISVDSLKMGKNAGILSLAEDFSPEQKEFFNDSLDRVYQDFSEKVAERRKFSAQKLDSVARGRVFTGVQAAQNGLIDKTGDIYDAFKAAEALAFSDKPLNILEFPLPPTRLEMLFDLFDSHGAVYWNKGFKAKGILPALKMRFHKLLQGDTRLLYRTETSF